MLLDEDFLEIPVGKLSDVRHVIFILLLVFRSPIMLVLRQVRASGDILSLTCGDGMGGNFLTPGNHPQNRSTPPDDHFQSDELRWDGVVVVCKENVAVFGDGSGAPFEGGVGSSG